MKVSRNRFLILQHEDDTPPGTLVTWLSQNHLSFEIFHPAVSSHWPDPKLFDGVVILGGSMNVDEESEHAWLRREKEFIQELIVLKKRTLGICLGAQLLAEALGAQVQRSPHWEVGWWPVKLDPLLRDMTQSFESSIPMFHWHQYQFSLPAGATRLASNEACPVQGFILNNVAALQFHPESSVEWIRQNATSSTASYKVRTWVQSELEMLNSVKLQPSMQDWFFRFLTSYFS